jgi:nucleotide-binding universal stress UspA family protein
METVTPTSQRPCVVVALPAKQDATSVVAFGELLSLRAGADLHLVHVISPVFGLMTVHQYRQPLDFFPEGEEGLARNYHEEWEHIEQSRKESCAKEFQALLNSIDPRVHASLTVIEGDIEAAVMDFVLHHPTLMVLVGASSSKLHILPALFSRTMQFMADSRAPVMVVPYDWKLKDKGRDRKIKILAADDLDPSSEVASKAIDLYALLGHAEIMHVNVQDYSELMVLASDYGVSSYFGDFIYPYTEQVPYASEALNGAAMEQNLKVHFQNLCAVKKVSVAERDYTASFLIGNVYDQLESVIQQFDADIVICGGHHHESLWSFFHYESMPDRLKLKTHRPVLIAPPVKRAA